MPRVVAGPGDCINSIAFAHGFFWQTVWDHPENQNLKTEREDPNVLRANDEVFVPDLDPGEESAATEQRHRFRRKGVPAKIKIRVMINDEPIANAPCTLVVDGQTTEMSTDGDGFVEINVSPGVREGELRVRVRGSVTVFPLDFGHLDPISTDEGVTQRLLQLGYAMASAEDLDRAVTAFREDHALGAGGIDDQFRDKLLSEFGQ